MSNLYQILKSILPSVESQQERDEAYLASATDIYDLERRMRDIDDRGRNGAQAVSVGLYTR